MLFYLYFKARELFSIINHIQNIISIIIITIETITELNVKVDNWIYVVKIELI